MTQATPPKDPASTDPGTDPENTPDPGTDPGTGGTEDEDEEEEDEAPTAEAYKKLERTARRREDALRKSQARIKELEAKGEEQPKEDPEAKANSKLVRASARTLLASAGVTDKADQVEVLEILNLTDIEVDAAGDPDEDEISDRIERLRKVFGGKAPATPATRRTPARQTADRGSGGGTDPDSARYQAILRQRG